MLCVQFAKPSFATDLPVTSTSTCLTSSCFSFVDILVGCRLLMTSHMICWTTQIGISRTSRDSSCCAIHWRIPSVPLGSSSLGYLAEIFSLILLRIYFSECVDPSLLVEICMTCMTFLMDCLQQLVLQQYHEPHSLLSVVDWDLSLISLNISCTVVVTYRGCSWIKIVYYFRQNLLNTTSLWLHKLYMSSICRNGLS